MNWQWKGVAVYEVAVYEVGCMRLQRMRLYERRGNWRRLIEGEIGDGN